MLEKHSIVLVDQADADQREGKPGLAAEAANLAPDVRILPIRQEQLQERLGERFRELDVPLLVEWPDGRRAALLFVLEEETDPKRFSIHRLAHYCLDLAELFAADRVVPLVIFLRAAEDVARQLRLGGDRHVYLRFDYLRCALAELRYEDYRDSDNLVARLTLPSMRYPPERRVEVYARAVRGLTTLEPVPQKRLKYLDFIAPSTASAIERSPPPATKASMACSNCGSV